ncbi:MAG: S1 RNA-binding domain-containing protein [bacterium]
MDENKTTSKDNLGKLLEKDEKIMNIPSPGDRIKGRVLTVSKNEVRLDIEGMTTGIVRTNQLYNDLEEYSNLKEGDEIEATVIELDNENGEMELSFKVAGQQKTWDLIREILKEKKIVKVVVKEANKGGLVAKLFSIDAFLPVSQLASEHYPKVQGGDKGKILEKLKRLINLAINVKIMNISEKEDMVIVSEKEAVADIQNAVISNFKEGEIVEGIITSITDFGAFVKIDSRGSEANSAEGLIHISEIAWQKIDNLKQYLKEGQRIKAKIINISGIKIFLSIKQLTEDPWLNIENTYKLGQTITGEIIKINPYGVIVKIDDDIQGLAHVSELSKEHIQNIKDMEKIVKTGDKKEFIIISMDCVNHRIGLSLKSSIEGAIKEEKEIRDPQTEEKGGGKEATEKKEAKAKTAKTKKPKKAAEKE